MTTEIGQTIQTIAIAIQALTAVFTLFAMVYLGWRQKEMTRRQINIELYEKRYRIYVELENLINYISTQGIPKSEKNYDNYIKKCDQRIRNFKSDRSDRDFLLNDELNLDIEEIIKELGTIPPRVVEILKSNNTGLLTRYHGYYMADAQLDKATELSNDVHQKFKARFKDILDFSEI